MTRMKKKRYKHSNTRLNILFPVLLFFSYSSIVLARRCYTEHRIDAQNGFQCPPGYELCDSDEGINVCQICGKNFYQPFWNDVYRLCKAKTVCDGPNMMIDQPGSHIQDTTCKCLPGYHFPGKIMQLCVDNDVCPPGQGQSAMGDGKCIQCQNGTFSNKNNNVQPCLNATVCEKHMQCELEESTPFADTRCSQPVADLTQCKVWYLGSTPAVDRTPEHALNNDGPDKLVYVGIGAAVFVVILVVVIVTVICCRRRREDNSVCCHENTGQILPREHVVSPDELVKMSNILGDKWSLVAPLLGFDKDYEHEKFSYNERRINVIAHNMLKQWKKDLRNNATVGKLIDAVDTAGVEKSDYQLVFPECFPLNTNLSVELETVSQDELENKQETARKMCESRV